MTSFKEIIQAYHSYHFDLLKEESLGAGVRFAVLVYLINHDDLREMNQQ